MLSIKSFIHNPFYTNCYIIHNKNEAIIIDPCFYFDFEKEEVINYIKENNLIIKFAIATHYHFDHLFGIFDINYLYKVQFAIHKDYYYLSGNFNIKEQAIFFGYNIKTPPSPKILLNDKDIIDLNGVKIQVIHTPGHSPCSICLYIEEEGIIFTGDTLFEKGVGRTDLPGGNFLLLKNSILNKLFKLPPETIVYPGHGDKTTISNEINYAFF